jgi:hypothetical protein
MIDPAVFLEFAINPGCKLCSMIMHREMGSDEARVLMLAIALQESGLEHRRQVGADGQPMDTLARGFSQFELGGGVHGVCTHSASSEAAQGVCGLLRVPFVEEDIHEALAWHDQLSSAFARLLLWTDAAPLPAVGDEADALDYYLRNWRPGKPHPEAWPAHYALAVETVSNPKGVDDAAA